VPSLGWTEVIALFAAYAIAAVATPATYVRPELATTCHDLLSLTI
jgi:hypothetical protein